MENQDQPIRRRRHWPFAVAGAALLGATWGAVHLSAAGKPAGETMVRVERHLVEKRIDVMGAIVDSGALHVAAPMDSKVVAVHFTAGQRIEFGQPLLTIDVADAALKARAARLELAKATHHFEQLRDWEQGVDVTRARRLAGEAELALAEARQRQAELDTLLAKGIIPRLEQEAGQRQVKQAETQYHMLNEELAQTLKKGNGAELGIARMEMRAAELRTAELEQLAAAGVLKAGRSGIILGPTRTARVDEPAPAFTPGSPLVKGKPLFRIVDGDSVTVAFKLNEVDVNRVRQAVEIRGDGFTGLLKGTISDIAAVGNTTSGPTAGAATFDVQARALQLDAVQRQQIRLGMSAMIAIIEPARSALVLPLRAVGERRGKPVVTMTDAKTGQRVEREVATGAATAEGVEIVAGLQAGEMVLLQRE